MLKCKPASRNSALKGKSWRLDSSHQLLSLYLWLSADCHRPARLRTQGLLSSFWFELGDGLKDHNLVEASQVRSSVPELCQTQVWHSEGSRCHSEGSVCQSDGEACATV